MQILFEQFYQMLEHTPMNFLREQINTINWDCRILGILGQKGVGKSTLILQHIKLENKINESLYVQADDIYFSANTLIGLAKDFFARGGKYLYIDEIHKYENWSKEIKMMYDLLPLLKIVYSGSSMLDLKDGGADLSRRVVQYHMPVWSFREFLNLKMGWNLGISTLEEILKGVVDFPYGEHRPLKYFNEYMDKGCYPFSQEPEFETKLRQIINTTVELDIPKYAKLTIASTQKLKKLMYYLSQNVPIKINYSDMMRDMGLDRNELPRYLEYLEKAELVSILRMKTTGNAILRKMDKLYLHNPNISYVLSDNKADIGNARETIFYCWTKIKYDTLESPVSDFEIEGKTFEIGGKKKGKKQIASVSEGYIVKDGIEYAYENQIPLWMFGFLY
ncbi:MAG: AAA family ATPase [Bacteroidales bacterium]|nr:AAA family ATPase [Bacteroidales bacterium]